MNLLGYDKKHVRFKFLMQGLTYFFISTLATASYFSQPVPAPPPPLSPPSGSLFPDRPSSSGFLLLVTRPDPGAAVPCRAPPVAASLEHVGSPQLRLLVVVGAVVILHLVVDIWLGVSVQVSEPYSRIGNTRER